MYLCKCFDVLPAGQLEMVWKVAFGVTGHTGKLVLQPPPKFHS